jgi:hypothetical protein
VIVVLLVVVPAVAVAVGGWLIAARVGAFSAFGDPAPAPTGDTWAPWRRLGVTGWPWASGGDDRDAIWPLRMLESLPTPVLMGAALVMGLWLVAWLVILAVGLSALSV